MKNFGILSVLALAASLGGCSNGSDETAKVAAATQAANVAAEGGTKQTNDTHESAVAQFYAYRINGDHAAAFEMIGPAYHRLYDKAAWVAAMKAIDDATGGVKQADVAAWHTGQPVRVEHAGIVAEERLQVSEAPPHRLVNFKIAKPEASANAEAASRGQRITDPATSLTFDQIVVSIAENRPADLINRMRFEQRTGHPTPWHLLAGQRDLTLLHAAAISGARDSVAELIDLGTPVDVVAEHGFTPLFLAACTGHLDTVKLLVNRGARTSYRNEKGQTPKDCAKAEGKAEVLAWLESQADDTPHSPFEPLWRLEAQAALRYEQLCVSVSQKLRSNPTHPQTVAEVKAMVDEELFGRSDSCFVLEDGPVDDAHHQVNAFIRGERGRGKVVGNLLALAAAVGSTEVVAHTIEHGFSPDGAMYSYKAMNGERAIGPAILIAAQNGHADVVQLLLDKGANPNVLDTGSMRRIMDYAEDPVIRRMLLDAANGTSG